MAAKTEQQRRAARKESRRRRRKVNRIAFAVLVTLFLLLTVLLVRACAGGDAEPTGGETGASTTAASTAATKAGSRDGAVSTTASTEDGEENRDTTAVATAPTKPQSTDGAYIQPAGAEWNLILVNGWNALSQDYVNSIPLAAFNASWNFDSRALPYLNQMLDDANAAGCSMWGQSLFRDYDTQHYLYWRQVDICLSWGLSQQEAEDEAATIVARPGTSEHNTGLAVDFECSEFADLDEGFEDTTAFAWLQEHCAEYGFILRFPKNKEAITGVIYEPWHYRYVGVEAATEIMSRGLCLEEYLQEKGL